LNDLDRFISFCRDAERQALRQLSKLGVQIGFGGVEFGGDGTHCGWYEISMSRKKKETRNVPVVSKKGDLEQTRAGV
jgi:hypothetical protein